MQIENESWEDIAHMAHVFHIELENEHNGTKKLKKELCFVRHILHEHLCNQDQIQNFINTNLFITMVNTVNKFEKAFDKHNIKRREFLLFLRAVLDKLKKEKLKAEKPLERKVEFKRMKNLLEKTSDGFGHMENGHEII
ncbi:hypothetical protein J4450_08405 [Candidatus Micrarchaeota archaeon]|nr:hypothetical protein [Candidatus Micrarchaeota archaeon]